MKHIIYILLLNLFIVNQSYAQCFDADASIWLDTWASCETSQNPKSEYGNTHWIQYDFGSVRKLSKTWVWNSNDPSKLNQGFNLVKIDHSTDGQEWTNWGEMNFPKASGDAVYSGFSGPDLIGIEAQYILVSAISNHGDPTCAGIAEIKFNLLPDNTSGTPPPGGGGDCAQVEEIFVEEVSAYEAFLFWEYEIDDDEEIIFIVQYQEEDGDIIEFETEDFEAFLEDLSPDTFYDFRIGVECDDEIVWSEISSFVTEPEETECFAVEETWEEWIGEEEAFFMWEGIEDIESYIVEYGIENDPQREIIEVFEPEIFIENLEPFSNYELIIGILCDDEILWSEPFYFYTEEDFEPTTNTVEAQHLQSKYKVFPNPTKRQITFQILSEKEDVLDYSITDINGKIVQTNQMIIAKGFNQTTLDLSNLADGIYLLTGITEKNRSLIQDRIVKFSN